MKVVLLFWLVFVAFVCGKAGDPSLSRGSDLIGWVEGGMKGTYIIFFFDQDASVKRTSDIRQQVKEKILDKYPNFHYYELDVTDVDAEEAVNMFEIDKVSLRHSPTVVVASDGRGYWAHGEGEVDEILYKIPYYSSDLRVPDFPINF